MGFRPKIIYKEGPDLPRAISLAFQLREAMRLLSSDKTSAKKEFYEVCVEFKVRRKALMEYCLSVSRY